MELLDDTDEPVEDELDDDELGQKTGHGKEIDELLDEDGQLMGQGTQPFGHGQEKDELLDELIELQWIGHGNGGREKEEDEPQLIGQGHEKDELLDELLGEDDGQLIGHGKGGREKEDEELLLEELLDAQPGHGSCGTHGRSHGWGMEREEEDEEPQLNIGMQGGGQPMHPPPPAAFWLITVVLPDTALITALMSVFAVVWTSAFWFACWAPPAFWLTPLLFVALPLMAVPTLVTAVLSAVAAWFAPGMPLSAFWMIVAALNDPALTAALISVWAPPPTEASWFTCGPKAVWASELPLAESPVMEVKTFVTPTLETSANWLSAKVTGRPAAHAALMMSAAADTRAMAGREVRMQTKTGETRKTYRANRKCSGQSREIFCKCCFPSARQRMNRMWSGIYPSPRSC